MILFLLISFFINTGMNMQLYAAQASNAELARLKQTRKTKNKPKTVWVKKQIKPEEEEKKAAASNIPGGPAVSYEDINTCQQATSASIETNVKQPEQQPILNVLPIKKIASTPEEQMIDAAREGNLNKVQALLKSGVNKDAQDSYGWTPLFWAIAQSNIQIANALINAHADLNIQDSRGWTTLMDVAARGNVKMVQMLIAAGANVNMQEDSGNTALMLAAAEGLTSIVQTLIRAGADVNMQDDEYRTALMYACGNGYKDIIVMLLKANADPYLATYNSQSILERTWMQSKNEARLEKQFGIVPYKSETFFSILRENYPELLSNVDIKEAFTKNKYVIKRFEEEKKNAVLNVLG